MTSTLNSNEVIVQTVLEDLGSAVGATQRGYVHASCPLAPVRHEAGVDNNPSFGAVYNPQEARREAGHAHCFSCGYSGDLQQITGILMGWGYIDQETFTRCMGHLEKLQTGNLPLSLTAHTADDPFPDSHWLASFQPVSDLTPEANLYLKQRGVDPKAVKAFDLRYDPQRYRVSVPLYDRAQRFRGLIGRTLIKDPQGPRYFYYPYKGEAPRGFTWLNEHRLDLSKPVLVVEGYFDALKVWPVYPNVTAALSVSFRKPGLGWMGQVKRWVTMFDIGQGGQLGRERLTEFAAPGSKIWHLQPPAGRNDPGESTPEEIRTRLDELLYLTPIKK